MKKAIDEEQLQTDFYRTCKLQISEAENNYNDEDKYKSINTFYCDPFEQISVTLSKDLSNGIMLRTMFRSKTLVVNLGMDK